MHVFKKKIRTVTAFTITIALMIKMGMGCFSPPSYNALDASKKADMLTSEKNAIFFNKFVDLESLLEESSTLQIIFEIWQKDKLIVTGTPTGAVARYFSFNLDLPHPYLFHGDPLMSKIDEKEWHDLITSLFNLVKGWEVRYNFDCSSDSCVGRSYFYKWEFEMSSKNYTFKSTGDTWPSNWSTFQETINSLVKKMNNDAKEKNNAWLEREYERRFGETIPNLGRSIITDLGVRGITLYRTEAVVFYARTPERLSTEHSIMTNLGIRGITLCRTEAGVFYAHTPERLSTEITIWDLLDFIKNFSMAANSTKAKTEVYNSIKTKIEQYIGIENKNWKPIHSTKVDWDKEYEKRFGRSMNSSEYSTHMVMPAQHE
jgi:hypothetical protein